MVGEGVTPGVVADCSLTLRDQVEASELRVLAVVLAGLALHAEDGELFGLPVGIAFAGLSGVVGVEGGDVELEHAVGGRSAGEAADQEDLVLLGAAYGGFAVFLQLGVEAPAADVE